MNLLVWKLVYTAKDVAETHKDLYQWILTAWSLI